MTPPTNQLIVTADDVGLHRGMTLGAIKAHRQGIVTACSVVANGRDLPHAVELLQDCPQLDVGVHLTLVEETPLCAASEVPGLVTATGSFHRNFAGFAARYFAGAVKLDEVEREFRAQIELLQEKGLSIVHANGHQHLHVLARIFDVVLALAEEYAIPYLRIPYELAPVRSVRSAALAAMNRFAVRARTLSAGHVRTNERTLGIAGAGHLTPASLLALIPQVKGLTELVCHPGIDDREIAREYLWGYEWDGETTALCDPAVRNAVQAAGVDLTAPHMIIR